MKGTPHAERRDQTGIRDAKHIPDSHRACTQDHIVHNGNWQGTRQPPPREFDEYPRGEARTRRVDSIVCV